MKLFELHEEFDTTTTKMDPYDNMLNDPEYVAKAKRRKHGIVYMHPLTYIEKAAKGFGSSYEDVVRSRDMALVDEYAEDMKRGDKFPLITLDYSMGFTQEGLHRAMAAAKLGYEKIPVMVVSLTPNKERKGAMASY